MAAARGRDQGSTHVLESVVVTCVMVSSIAFVVTFEAPPTGADAGRQAVGQRARDILAILNDTPVAGSTFGNNVLSVGLLECLQSRCDRLSDAIDRLMPVGAKYGVYLSTGDGLYPVYTPREPSGEAVTARRLIEPAWSYQFMATSQDVYNPLEDPLVVSALPVYSASPIHTGGSALQIMVTGERGADKAAIAIKGSATTRAVAAQDEPSPAGISLFFHAGDGAPLATRDVRATTLSAPGIPSGASVGFSVRVAESGGGIVPAGTLLHVVMPHGWTATAADGADWDVVETANDPNGSKSSSSIVAKLLSPITNAHKDLAFAATYQGDANDHYPFHAYLSAGAYAQGALLVRADAHGTQPVYEVPTMLASVPRPLGSGATTTWTLAASSPDVATITRIEIREEQGRTLFASVASISGGGSWTAEPDRLVWTGSATLHHGSPLSLAFSVTSTTLGGPAVDRAPFVPAIDLGNFSGAMPEQTSPGLHRGVFLPATATYGGYDPTIAGLRSDHPIASGSVYRTTALPGSITYGVGLVAGVQDSVFGSSVAVDKRYVKPGERVEVSIETQTLLYRLGVLGLDPTVTLQVYPPWAGDDRTPIHTEALYNGTVAKGTGTFLALLDTDGDLVPDPTTIGRLNAGFAIPPHWLYGPYIVEGNVTWLETFGAPPTTILRSARVHDYFVVQPSSGEDVPASPVYDVHLLTWYEDWG